MIAIIKQGHSARYRFECKDCGCIFTCDKTDLDKVCANMYTTDITYYSINCPECNESITIPVDDLGRYEDI